MQCPDVEQLERHLSGELPDAQQDTVSSHVAGCADCKLQLREISENLEALSGVRDVLSGIESLDETPLPDAIGPYRILREIARGGTGVVYLAQQERPRREVALKVLRPGVTTPETLRRFELEADLLARLRHPGIATIYEAGVTEIVSSGTRERVPYIAMEFIRGERLDRHAESARLSIAERLDLVARVADAVHHAHVKGLIHRDLKPGNILVEAPRRPGAPGEPKVLDFGIARTVDDERAGTLLTSTGQVLGTVPYMSPEQLSGDPSAVDARSDVYAIGVIAYLLLTGELPHDVARRPIAEAARAIVEESPRSPGSFEPRLRGDVETILLKALEKEPARRYTSAAELAADIRRFLRHEPIQARPQSAWYQAQRFCRRNRGLAAALAALVLVMLGAAVVSSVLALRATRAEELARGQLDEARRQADKFAAVNRFLEEMLGAPSPEEHPGDAEVTVREVLERGGRQLDGGSFADEPGIELGVRTTIGNTYRALGQFDEARRQLERAVELGRTLHPDGHEDLAFALNKLARVEEEAGELDAAEANFREALEMRRGLDGPRSEEVAVVLNNLAHLLSTRGQDDDALSLYSESLEIRRELFGASHEEIANSLNNIAVLHFRMGDLEQAEAMLRQSLEMDTELRGELHPNVAATMNNLAQVITRSGRLDEAEPLQRRALELERQIYGAGHPKLANSLVNLARLFVATDRLQQAEPLFLEAIAVERKARGDRHPAVANLLGNYASLFEARGELDRAEALHEEALAIRREALGEDAVATLGSRYNLARVAMSRGAGDAAARAYAELARDARRTLPADSRPLFTILSGYALCLFELERPEAKAVLEEALQAGPASVGENDPRLQQLREALAGLDTER